MWRIFILLFFVSAPALAQNVAVAQPLSTSSRVLVKQVEIDGFVLDDKDQFVKLFKPYHNKYLSAVDINAILEQLQEIYELAGFQGLVSIDYHVTNKRLIFVVSLIK